MEDSRPGNLTPEVTFCIESDVEVKNTSILHLNLKSLEKTVDYIKINYTKIQKKISNNKLPTQKNFINELKMFLFKDEY